AIAAPPSGICASAADGSLGCPYRKCVGCPFGTPEIIETIDNERRWEQEEYRWRRQRILWNEYGDEYKKPKGKPPVGGIWIAGSAPPRSRFLKESIFHGQRAWTAPMANPE